MTIESLKNIVNDHIAKAKTEKAIAVQKNWADSMGSPNAKAVINLISNNWNALENEKMLGIARDVGTRTNEINFKILHFDWEMALPVIIPIPPIETDLNILFMGANPFKASKVPLYEMFYEIEKRLKTKKTPRNITLNEYLFARKKDFQDKILNQEPKPNIIHFTGLGKLTKVQKDKLCKITKVANWELFGGLIFHDSKYQSIESVNAEDIGNYFKLFVEDEKLPIHTVILSACYAAPQAKAIAQYVPYVIGMRKEVDETFALDFSEQFYSALAVGKEVKEAVFRAQTLADISKAREYMSFYVDGQLQVLK